MWINLGSASRWSIFNSAPGAEKNFAYFCYRTWRKAWYGEMSMTLSMNAVYNLKAVLKETGIKPDVLRAWERRYGLPMPQRSPGGHRLYSEHDIGVIKWLLSRQEEGLSISHAVEMWNEKLVNGVNPLLVLNESAQPVGLSTTRHPLVSLVGIDELRSRWLAACLNFNETAAELTLNQAFALYPVERSWFALVRKPRQCSAGAFCLCADSAPPGSANAGL